jgi:hypothetical protein
MSDIQRRIDETKKRELLMGIIDVQIKLDNQNTINQEIENIKQKVFSIGLIEKTNEIQIEKSINILYEQHLNYHEFIYKQINVLGGYFHKHSTTVLLKKIETGIKNQSGEDFEDKIINYFIIKNLSKSHDKSIKKDFFYQFYITRYENRKKVYEKINEKEVEIKNKIKELEIKTKNLTHKVLDSNLKNKIETINDKLSILNKINTIIGEMYFTSRLNLFIVIIFFILKYKFDFELGFISFLLFLLFGIIVRLILNLVYDKEKLKNELTKNEKTVTDFVDKLRYEKNNVQDKINEYNNYIKSLKEFIV